jgi:hypothetical protein
MLSLAFDDLAMRHASLPHINLEPFLIEAEYPD